MKKFLMYLWQLPQNILGLIVIFFSDGKYEYTTEGKRVYSTKHNFGVSLGKYIITDNFGWGDTVKHEYGHCLQSEKLGWLYLVIIGLPSIAGNLYDRIAHRNWNYKFRDKWYYSQPWEAWADRLGGVKRWWT